MAGGSADAAAALVALDRLWELGTADDDLLALAAGLGSDVPFALVGGTAHGTGRGEVRRRRSPDRGDLVVGGRAVDDGLSTPAVYRRFDEMFPDAPADARELRGASSPRWRPATRPPRPRRCTTTSRRPRSTCDPSSAS